MQPLSPEAYANVTRRPLDIEDYLDILRRHKAWILAPLFGALVIAVVVAFLWPDTYVSVAMIRVVPPQVPESYVPTNVNQQMSQRINAMYQTISSRATLTSIINMFNLYPRERARKPMEDVIEDMKSSIKLGQLQSLGQGHRGEVSAFTITFSYQNRITAQKVTADLVSRFMNENTRERTQQSVQTTVFLKDQLDTAKKELDAIEEKLANFRQTFQGRLPDEINQNHMQLNSLENRVSNLSAALSRLNQEKMLLESDLRSAKTLKASLIPAPDQIVQRQKNEELSQIEREILQLENGLANLREHYKDVYPEVRKVQIRLETARKTRAKLLEQDEAQKNAQNTSAQPKRFDPMYEREARAADGSIARLETEIKAKDAEMENTRKELAKIEGQIRTVQSRIEAAPLSQQQYSEVIRDREVARAKYDDLNRKRQQSSIAEELERRQQGETLDLLEPASLPASPAQPNRPMIVGAGAALGLIFGLVLAGAREAKDTSLKNLKDVRAYTQLTILGSVPLLENDLVVRRRKRLALLAWSTACLVGILIMTGAVFYYFATKI